MSKRFVTYRTEDAKAGLINVDEDGVIKPGGGGGLPTGGGSGLPTGGEPFKQLVTDADGKTVWEDRLAYLKPLDPAFFSNATLQEKTSIGQGHYTYTVTNNITAETFPAGNYILHINGKMYDFVLDETSADTNNLANSNDKISQDITYLKLQIVDGKTKFTIYPKTAFDDTLPVSLYYTKVVIIDPKFLPTADAVADAAGETPTATEFNALLASLREAGYLNT